MLPPTLIPAIILPNRVTLRMKVVLSLLKRMLRMLRLLEVGKGGWKGRETKIRIKW